MDGFRGADPTEAIDCTELTAAEVAWRIDVYYAEPDHRVDIDSEEWAVAPDGKLERAGNQKL